MPNPTNEELNPKSLVLPNFTTSERDLLIVELGYIIFNTTTGVINFCDVGQTAGSSSWAVVTSTT